MSADMLLKKHGFDLMGMHTQEHYIETILDCLCSEMETLKQEIEELKEKRDE